MMEWGLSLYGLSAEEIRRGIDQAKLVCDWPPTIKEFVGLCKGDAAHRSSAYVVRKALPKPQADREVVKGHLSVMRGVLR
jgi:hypothetical protein